MLPNDPAPQPSTSSGTGAADPGAPAAPANSYLQSPVAIQPAPVPSSGVRRGPSILAIAIAVVALAGCGVDTMGTAATAAALKKQEL